MMSTQTFERVLRNLTIWTLVCLASAAPSFVIGWLIHDGTMWAAAAMGLGVAVFIATYTAVASTDRVEQLRKRPFVQRTIYIGYGIRIVQSFLSLTGVGAIPDMYCGLFSAMVVEAITGSTTSGRFEIVFLWTITQGIVLNIILGLLLLIIYAIQRFVLEPPPVADARSICAACGYDLRASTDRCPECGTPIPDNASLSGA